jgi:hypothetical protein
MFSQLRFALLSNFCLFLSLSCASQPDGLRVDAKGKRPMTHRVVGDPILPASSVFVLIPFWTETTDTQGKLDLLPSSSGFGSFSYSGNWSTEAAFNRSFGDYTTCAAHWNNIVFYDKRNGSTRLLLDRKAVICSAYFPPDETGRPANGERKPMYFGIAEKDTNGDGYINSSDAVVLYGADASGTTLTRLTPEGTQLSHIVADGDHTLYVRVLQDSNGDHNFTGEDQALILRVDLAHMGEGKPVLNEEIQKRAESILEAK